MLSCRVRGSLQRVAVPGSEWPLQRLGCTAGPRLKPCVERKVIRAGSCADAVQIRRARGPEPQGGCSNCDRQRAFWRWPRLSDFKLVAYVAALLACLCARATAAPEAQPVVPKQPQVAFVSSGVEPTQLRPHTQPHGRRVDESASALRDGEVRSSYVAEVAATDEPVPEINGADTAWVLISTTIVLMMTLPGLALFYGGLMRASSLNSMLLYHMFAAAFVSVLWIAFGYSAAFSTTGMVDGEWTVNAVIGALDKAFLNGVTTGGVVETIPEYLWVMFQMTFAIITPCIMIGAVAERMRFSAAAVWTALWVPSVYLPVAHMVWAGPGSLLGDLGVLDFAGGLVVHITSGFAGLVAALMLGPRQMASPGTHSLPLFMIGTSLLWVGWMGFNVGSALTAGASAAAAMVATQAAAAAAVLTWLSVDWFSTGKPSIVGACTGALAGLVVVTPAAGFVGPAGALAMGVIGALCCRTAVVHVKSWLNYDDALDAFGVHGVGGFIGNLLVAVFAHPSFGGNQDMAHMGSQLLVQLAAGAIVVLWAVAFSYLTLCLTRAICGGLRVSEDGELDGTDSELEEPKAYCSA